MLLSYIDTSAFIARLSEAVAISPSPSPAKKTVLVYGHFDLQPAVKSDGWDTEPFILTEEKDGRLAGRGTVTPRGRC
jgi:acetylornithine deacetylase/succinyl-diaminopimelate desuccinylase-like protein